MAKTQADILLKQFYDAYEKWNARKEGGEDDLHYAARQAEAFLEGVKMKMVKVPNWNDGRKHV